MKKKRMETLLYCVMLLGAAVLAVSSLATFHS